MLTPGPVFTWRVPAPVHNLLAVGPSPPCRTVAGKVAFAIHTTASISARLFGALRLQDLAVGTRVARRTHTCVVVDSVHTLAAVHARTGRAVLVVDLAVCAREPI